jgi:hypothetical protein
MALALNPFENFVWIQEDKADKAVEGRLVVITLGKKATVTAKFATMHSNGKTKWPWHMNIAPLLEFKSDIIPV